MFLRVHCSVRKLFLKNAALADVFRYEKFNGLASEKIRVYLRLYTQPSPIFSHFLEPLFSTAAWEYTIRVFPREPTYSERIVN